MTLIPVSNISTTGLWSSNLGGSRWLAHFSSDSTGSPLSIASPSTLNIRPNVCFPTGTLIGPPVAVTSIPL